MKFRKKIKTKNSAFFSENVQHANIINSMYSKIWEN